MRIVHRRVAVLVVAAACVVAVGAQSPPATTTRVSVATGGGQASGNSYELALSGDARFVAFQSYAANLVAGDVNGHADIFVRDRQSGVTTLESVAAISGSADEESSAVAINADGRYVVFQSVANDLVPNDTNGSHDIFLRDRDSGTTTRVSESSLGAQGNAGSLLPSISADGRYIAFQSTATNLVVGDTNAASDVFVHDRVTGATSRVSVSTNGTQGNNGSYVAAISADGMTVAFCSDASNLVSGDTNALRDVFVKDRASGTTSRVSVTTGGAQGNAVPSYPAISANGRVIAFDSDATNLVTGDTNLRRDVFVRDRDTGTTTRVSVAANGTQGNGDSYYPSISGDGRIVTFNSESSNLVTGDTNGVDDVFVHNRDAGATTRVSVATNGTQGNGYSNYQSAISADGYAVGFASIANNLVTGDTNGAFDLFLNWTPVPTPPGAPGWLTGSVNGSTISLSWQAPSGPESEAPSPLNPPTGYIIEAGNGPGLSNLATFNTGNTLTSYSANGVSTDEYYIRVRATNAVGTSGPSNEVRLIVGNVPPGAPSGLSVGVSGSTVSLAWTAPTTGGVAHLVCHPGWIEWRPLRPRQLLDRHDLDHLQHGRRGRRALLHSCPCQQRGGHQRRNQRRPGRDWTAGSRPAHRAGLELGRLDDFAHVDGARDGRRPRVVHH